MCSCATSTAVLPKYVWVPVAYTRAPISPWRMIDPEYTGSPGEQVAGNDSPVSADWSTSVSSPSSSRASAGTMSTRRSRMMSPGTSSRGAITVYSRDKDAFTDQATQLGEQFASPAVVAVHNAQVLAKAQELTRQLTTAMTTRPIIDQAIGLLRGRTGSTTEEAFARLRELSQAEHTKVVVVAQRLVDEAVRRARANHVES